MKYAIVGGTGSWGKELTRQLLDRHEYAEILIYSRNEYLQVSMQREFKDKRLKFVTGDIRDYSRLKEALTDINIVYELSALKHVPVCEEQPEEAIKTNILGTLNLIKACEENGVSKAILVSTDKACNPLNTYGITKALAEKLFINADKNSSTKYIVIRSGNVLGTNGSVVKLFKDMATEKGKISLTDLGMTRFFFNFKASYISFI